MAPIEMSPEQARKLALANPGLGANASLYVETDKSCLRCLLQGRRTWRGEEQKLRINERDRLECILHGEIY